MLPTCSTVPDVKPAVLFIGEFVEAGIPWAHIDIGGTSTAAKTAGFKVKGGTGFGVSTLIKLAQEM